MLVRRDTEEDVAAVKLPNREQVQRRSEHPDPRRPTNRVHHNPTRIDMRMKQCLEKLQEWRIAKENAGMILNARHDLCRSNAVGEGGRSNQKSHDRPCNANVKKRLPRRDR